MAKRYGITFLTHEEFSEYQAVNEKSEEDGLAWRISKVTPRLKPFWYFTVRLCQQLQEGENRMSSTDAYWLGIVDEVVGTDLQGYRALMESIPEDETPKITSP